MAPPVNAPLEQIGAWLNLQQVNRVLQGLLEERLRAETDLSWPEFELLWRLEMAADHPLQMSDLAAQLLASPSGTTRMADRLERDGLIMRATPRENRRVVYVHISEQGAEVLRRAREVFGAALAEVFSNHLSQAEVHALRLVLRKLLERNGAWDEDRCEPPFRDRARRP
jgi:DNA-binding MarR family transcriptional regulator